MSDAGHPSRHGYVKCMWCGCWRRQGETVEVAFPDGSLIGPDGSHRIGCKDVKLCDRLLSDKQATQSPETDRPATFDVKPGWDANGSETR